MKEEKGKSSVDSGKKRKKRELQGILYLREGREYLNGKFASNCVETSGRSRTGGRKSEHLKKKERLP